VENRTPDIIPLPATMNMPKVLIITRDFVPYCFSFGGIVRVLKLAEYLGENGVEVFVLAAKGEEIGYFGYRDLVRGLKVTYLEDRLQPLLNRITDASSASALQKINRSSAGFRIFKKLVNELSIPDVGIFFVGKFIREGARLVRQHGIRNVLVTSPPPSMLLSGYALKKKFGDRINFIVDYRDSWTSRFEVARKKSNLLNRLNRRLEKRVLQKADHFTYVSRPMMEALLPHIDGLRSKSILVMNGFDEKMFHPEKIQDTDRNCLRIGHFGRLIVTDTHKNPERLFRSIERCRGKIKLCLYGDVLIPENWKEILSGIVECRGTVPHEEALREMQKMDVLLLYHTEREGSKEVVTGKLFEYMLARRPILVMGPPDMEAAEIVRKERIGYTVDLFDPTAVEAALQNVYTLWKEGMLIRYDIANLKQYSRQNQYSKILPLLA
jgi:glycosyltransferase involved in cell wall biosynthesis